MKQAYYCDRCGHVFILSGSIVDGRNCADCHGPLIPCTIGIDLASGEDLTYLIDEAKNSNELLFAVDSIARQRMAEIADERAVQT